MLYPVELRAHGNPAGCFEFERGSNIVFDRFSKKRSVRWSLHSQTPGWFSFRDVMNSMNPTNRLSGRSDGTRTRDPQDHNLVR